MEWAVGSTTRALQRHGMDLVYRTTVRVIDPIQGSVTETPTDYTLRIYPRPMQATQYNYPTLVGKQTVMFYLAADSLAFLPKPSDSITYLGESYRVNSFQAHTAHGKTILYKIIGVKG